MNNPSISNPPTSFPTPAMIEAARQASDWVADLRDDEITHIYLAMHKASPSTEAVERVARAIKAEFKASVHVSDGEGLTDQQALWLSEAAITSLTSPTGQPE